MKKYFILFGVSFTLSIFIIIQLYKTKDIDFIDAIVENTVETLSIKSDFVAKKIERKEVEQILKQEEERKLVVERIEPKIDLEALKKDSIYQVRKTDSLQAISLEKKTIDEFNKKMVASNKDKVIQLDTASGFNTQALKKEVVEEPVMAFNVMKKNSPTPTNQAEGLPTRFFKAKVHNTQQIQNDMDLTLRTDEEVIINGFAIPKNTIFKAKINMFSGRITAISDKVGSHKFITKNYDQNNNVGIPILDRYKQKDALILVDGEVLSFSY